MWPFRRRPDAQTPRLRELSQRVDELEADVAHLATQLKSLRGRVTGSIRKASEPDASLPREAGDATASEVPLPRGVSDGQARPRVAGSTAHLSSRFKIGG